jgi:cytochrome b6-f complex iron-sulfur subunit
LLNKSGKIKMESLKQDNNTNIKSRRSFLKYMLNTAVSGFIISVLYPIYMYLKPPQQNDVEVSSVNAGKLDQFEIDKGKIIRFGNKPVLVIRQNSGEIKAFLATCTHLDCTVQYRSDLEVIWCACHNGKYDLTGRNVSGPPPRPLTEYKTVIKNDELIILNKT